MVTLVSDKLHTTIDVKDNHDGTYTVHGPKGTKTVSKETYNSMIQMGNYHTGGKRRRTKRVRKSRRRRTNRRR
jgi:hypothetical protein